MQDMRIGYEARGMNNYLSIQVEAEVNGYQLKMMEKNSIPGLLPVSGKMLNGVYCFNYDITGMKRLKDVMDGGYLQGSAAKKFFAEIMRNMVQIEEYFLVFGNCLLKSEYIFVDERQKPRMAYVPVRGIEITNAEMVKEFYRELTAGYFRFGREQFFVDLLVYVNSSDFSLPGLSKKLEEGADVASEEIPERMEKGNYEKTAPLGMNAALEFAASKDNTSYYKGGMGLKEDRTANSNVMKGSGMSNSSAMKGSGMSNSSAVNEGTEGKTSVSFAVPGNETGGFAIPGMDASGESTQEKDEKKKSSLFGKLLKNEKQENEPEGKKEKKNKKEKESERVEETKGKNSFWKPFSEKKAKEQPAPDMGSYSEFSQGQQGNSSAWSGTCTLDEPRGGRTEIIGADSTPYLLHQNRKVTLKKFPFAIGQLNGDYLIQNPAVSRTHASILAKDGHYYIRDENSSNHTYVNGNRIAPYTEVEIHAGDALRLANEEMSFMVG